RNRCYELTDDLVVHQELVKCLKRGVVAAHNQRDAFFYSQIDLDLEQMLPNNKLFESEQSPKVASLEHILYAFRFHNRSVEYCQGLNRLGAIGTALP
uniref:Rab-GAP TBC domain-containing protein n=1 Tax=Globodera pallida TaxID=36090 RepID=A0A183CSC6_GLOPA